MIRKFFLIALLALFAVPTTAQAQVDASMTATVVYPLSVTKAQDLAWNTDIVINNGAVVADQFAQWDVVTEAGVNMTMNMSVPATLTSGANTIDVTYGSTSAHVVPCAGSAVQWDPTSGSGVCNGITDGNQGVYLGWGSGGDGDVSTIAPAGSQPGTYTGTATLTVSVS